MVDKVHTADVSSIKTELEEALSTLDRALLEAGRSVAIVRGHVAQIVELADRSREMEAAMLRARELLAMSSEDSSATPPLRALPPVEPAEDIGAPVMEPEPQFDRQPDKTNSVAVEEPEQEEAAPIPAPSPSAETSRCLRLAVRSKSGNLDLKKVDTSVNENPAVIDVALLDYDGRQATLKLWINEAADPDGVRDALLSSLRNHLGEKDTELTIESEEDSSE